MEVYSKHSTNIHQDGTGPPYVHKNALDIADPCLDAVCTANLHLEAESQADPHQEPIQNLSIHEHSNEEPRSSPYTSNQGKGPSSVPLAGLPLTNPDLPCLAIQAENCLQQTDRISTCIVLEAESLDKLHNIYSEETEGSSVPKKNYTGPSMLHMDTEGQNLNQQSSQALDKALLNMLDQLGQQIVKTGGVTFAVVGITGLVSAIIFLNELDHLVVMLLKLFSVTPLLLAWYWISSNSEIRQVTDAVFLAWFKMILRWRFLPKIVRNLAEKL